MRPIIAERRQHVSGRKERRLRRRKLADQHLSEYGVVFFVVGKPKDLPAEKQGDQARDHNTQGGKRLGRERIPRPGLGDIAALALQLVSLA
jgi:hypothetical protein